MTASLATFRKVASQESGLCVVTVQRGDGTMAASVVNAGVMPHPVTGAEVVAYVARGTKKLEHLRGDPQTTVVARNGWRWAAVEGTAELYGPDDAHPDIDAERLRLLLREVFTAAGGSHDDWDEYDRVMRDERSAAVLIAPSRSYPSNQ
jgi:PPOX class probable F420-dependent enzyme